MLHNGSPSDLGYLGENGVFTIHLLVDRVCNQVCIVLICFNFVNQLSFWRPFPSWKRPSLQYITAGLMLIWPAAVKNIEFPDRLRYAVNAVNLFQVTVGSSEDCLLR